MRKKVLIIAIVAALFLSTGSAFAAKPLTSLTQSAGDNWNLYSNLKLGFSLQIPKEGRLEGHVRGDTEYFAINKIEIIEKGNIVYISSGNEYQYGNIQKSVKSNKSEIKRVKGVPWAILVKKVRSDTQLKTFIKQKYGSSCKLGTKTPSKQKGVFDVEVVGDGKDLDKTKCPLNFITYIKYYPKAKKVATWDIGQAPNFEIDGGEPVDDKMSDSFMFMEE